MPQDKTSYFRMQRELIQIKQGFWAKDKHAQPLNYKPKPLDLLKPNITAEGSGDEGDTSAKISVSYQYSHHEMLLLAIWNQCEILMKHEEGALFSTEETSEFYANFNAFKAHPHAPDYRGVFAVSDAYTYLIAICWCRWLNSLPPKVLEDLNLVDFHQVLQREISRYTLNQQKHAFLLKNDVTKDDVIDELEKRFKEIYQAHKFHVDKISDNQLVLYVTLRTLGYLVALSMLAVALSILLPLHTTISSGLATIAVLCMIFSPVVGVAAHMSTRVNRSISECMVKENNLKYNESKAVTVKEFPYWKPKTTGALIDECEKPEDRALIFYLQ
jgi:hypothetical protein